MKIAVITPYYEEPLWKLERCHESVLRQTAGDVTHFMIADGQPREEVTRGGLAYTFSSHRATATLETRRV